MLRKYSVLAGISISIVLLLVATLYYPGGSQYDKNSIGFDWKNNYLSNLFSEKAVNGADNLSRGWAIVGMLFLCGSFALFFFEFSKKIEPGRNANIIKYFGAGSMLFAFLAVTPYHNSVLIIAGTMALVSMFYITVFVFKSGLHLFKILSTACLLVFYSCNFIYYTSTYIVFLPIFQKVLIILTITWVLSLHYFTTPADFQKNAAGINP